MIRESARCIGCPVRQRHTCPPERKRLTILTLLNHKKPTPEAIDVAGNLLSEMKQDYYLYKCPSKQSTEVSRPLHRRVSRIRTRILRTGRVQQVPEMQY